MHDSWNAVMFEPDLEGKVGTARWGPPSPEERMVFSSQHGESSPERVSFAHPWRWDVDDDGRRYEGGDDVRHRYRSACYWYVFALDVTLQFRLDPERLDGWDWFFLACLVPDQCEDLREAMRAEDLFTMQGGPELHGRFEPMLSREFVREHRSIDEAMDRIVSLYGREVDEAKALLEMTTDPESAMINGKVFHDG